MSGRSNPERNQRQTRTQRDTTDTDQVAVPVAEEQLNVEKRQAELGEVQVRKTVTEEEQSIPVELRREEVQVQQRDISDRPLQAGEDAFQEGTIRIPVRGEEAVVSKEAVVTGEVMIGKQQTTERQTVSDTVRKERVEVDEDYQQHRDALQQHFTQRQSGMAGQQTTGQRMTGQRTRTFEEAEPNYQYGYTSARDTRYQGREFEDVEPDLQTDYESRQSSGGTSSAWQDLRDEVREGWNRARGR